MFFGGGEFGLGHKHTIDVLRTLTNYLDTYQIVAISGKNKKMNTQFLNLQNKINNKDLHIYKYTNQVPELMSISDLVITKPGGLTSSESIASGLPLIIINPIPGQEEGNANFLVNSGAAIWLKETDNIEATINRILSDSRQLENMKICAEKISHKYSTKEICDVIMN